MLNPSAATELPHWCLLEGSWAMDPLNGFAISGSRQPSHDHVAAQMAEGAGGLYTYAGGAILHTPQSAVYWLTRPRGIHWQADIAPLRDRWRDAVVWRRQMVLGPAAEFGSKSRAIWRSRCRPAGNCAAVSSACGCRDNPQRTFISVSAVERQSRGAPVGSVECTPADSPCKLHATVREMTDAENYSAGWRACLGSGQYDHVGVPNHRRRDLGTASRGRSIG